MPVQTCCLTTARKRASWYVAAFAYQMGCRLYLNAEICQRCTSMCVHPHARHLLLPFCSQGFTFFSVTTSYPPPSPPPLSCFRCCNTVFIKHLKSSIARPGCISQSRHKTARALIRAGANMNAANGANVSPLHAATASGDVNFVTDVILSGAILGDSAPLGGSRIDNGATPLHEACYRGFLTIAQGLLACGANPKQIDANGMTPLMVATHYGRTAIVEWLTFVTTLGWYTLFPIQIAADARLHVLCLWLLERGADPLAKAPNTPSSLLLASNINESRYLTARPICPVTRALVRKAVKPWSPMTHRLFGPSVNRSAFILFTVQRRLVIRGSTHLPCLPPELWCAIVSFVPRETVKTDQLYWHCYLENEKAPPTN